MATMPDPTASRAVLIGTGDYSQLPPLPAVMQNLTALADTLTGDRSWGLARAHCTVLADPTGADAVHAVRAAAEEATDALLVYVAGHARLDPDSGELFLGLPDMVEGRPATGLGYGPLREAALAGPARHRVVLLDCCLGGPVPGRAAGVAAVADAAQFAGGCLLIAAPGSVPEFAPPGEQYTAFTGALLRVLAEGIPYGPEVLRLDTVYEHSRAALRAAGRPVPERRAQDASAAGRMAFARNAASPAAGAPPVAGAASSGGVPSWGGASASGSASALGGASAAGAASSAEQGSSSAGAGAGSAEGGSSSAAASVGGSPSASAADSPPAADLPPAAVGDSPSSPPPSAPGGFGATAVLRAQTPGEPPTGSSAGSLADSPTDSPAGSPAGSTPRSSAGSPAGSPPDSPAGSPVPQPSDSAASHEPPPEAPVPPGTQAPQPPAAGGPRPTAAEGPRPPAAAETPQPAGPGGQPPGAFGAPPPAFGAAPPPFTPAPAPYPAPHAAPPHAASPHGAPPHGPVPPGAPPPGFAPPGVPPAFAGTPSAPVPPGAPPAPLPAAAYGPGQVPTASYGGAGQQLRTGGAGESWWRRRRVRFASVAAALVVVAATAVTVVAWPDDDSSGDSRADRPVPSASGGAGPEGGGRPEGPANAVQYNAATKGVVNASERRGGTLKFVATQDADSWDPQRGYYGFTWNFARYYSRQLVTYAPEPGTKSARLVPDLATGRAKVSDDGKTYTYTLREGARWEDGTPVTSRDVKYGIERGWASEVLPGGPAHLREVLDPKGDYRGPYEDKTPDKLGLRAIDTPDDRTITFTLPKPNRDFEHLLAMPAASPVPRAKDTKAKYGLRPFSSGPYRFSSYNPGTSLVLERNPAWQRAADPVRTALPDRITVDFVRAAEARDGGLLAGRYDLDLNAFGLERSALGRVWGNPRLKTQLDNPYTGTIRYAALASNVRPFDNVHCRRAVFYATDKRAVQNAAGGPDTGGALAPYLLSPGVSGGEDGYDPYGVLRGGGTPDLAKARQELKECGKPNGFRTVLTVSEGRVQETAAAEAVRASLARVGITVTVKQLPVAEFFQRVGRPSEVKKGGYGINLMRWSADYPTAPGMLGPLVEGRNIHDEGNVNVALIDDKALDKLFESARSARDEQQATRVHQQINRKVSELAGYLPLTHQKAVTWRSTRLTNVTTINAYGGGYDFATLGVAR